jgi:hypothetical protein
LLGFWNFWLGVLLHGLFVFRLNFVVSAFEPFVIAFNGCRIIFRIETLEQF